MIRPACFLLLLLAPVASHGQWFGNIGEAFHQKPKLYGSLTQYNSFISNEKANISGLRAGLEFNHLVRIAAGYNWLNSSIVDLIHVNDASGGYYTNGELKFRYGSISAEYIYFNKSPWELSATIQAGGGGAHYEYLRRTDKARVTTDGFPLVLAEPSITAQYSILDWFGVQGGLGYRVTLNSTKEMKKDFNAPVYVIKLKFFFEEIYKEIRGK